MGERTYPKEVIDNFIEFMTEMPSYINDEWDPYYYMLY